MAGNSYVRRFLKRSKKLAVSSVPDGENLAFYDYATPLPAEEIASFYNRSMAKGLSGAAITVATVGAAAASGTVDGRVNRGGGSGDTWEEYVIAVTDRAVRIMLVRATLASYARVKGSEDIVLPLGSVEIETGAPSLGKSPGARWKTVPVTFTNPESERITLHCFREQEWRELSNRQA